MRRLTPDWLNAATAVLDRRLLRHAPAPLAVAFSGGGDSLALLLVADAWARRHGRRLVVLTVDHRLQPDAAAWPRACAARAGALGAVHRTLEWTGDKPLTGVPAAARAARHRLLAEAAREAGARVILLGHTADDLSESAAMRACGSTVPDAREWGPSPVWPEGRDVFLLRPLLAARREALRLWLAERGEAWIDDPANADTRFARARARAGLAQDLAPPQPATSPPTRKRAFAARGGEFGGLVFEGEPPRGADLAAALVCAGGGRRPPRTEALRRLSEQITMGAAGTLAGAKALREGERVIIAREPGRQDPPLTTLSEGRSLVWDGRFEIRTDRPGLRVGALARRAARLEKREREALRGVPAGLRGGLPVTIDAAGQVSCPILAVARDVTARSLVTARFLAATGQVTTEPDT